MFLAWVCLQYAFGVGACLDGAVPKWWWRAGFDATPAGGPYGTPAGAADSGGPADGPRGSHWRTAAPSSETLASAGERDSGQFPTARLTPFLSSRKRERVSFEIPISQNIYSSKMSLYLRMETMVTN